MNKYLFIVLFLISLALISLFTNNILDAFSFLFPTAEKQDRSLLREQEKRLRDTLEIEKAEENQIVLLPEGYSYTLDYCAYKQSASEEAVDQLPSQAFSDAKKNNLVYAGNGFIYFSLPLEHLCCQYIVTNVSRNDNEIVFDIFTIGDALQNSCDCTCRTVFHGRYENIEKGEYNISIRLNKNQVHSQKLRIA